MGRFFAILCVILLIPGCGQKDKHMTTALKLRETVIAAEHTSFQAEILADYGQEIYKFKVEFIDGFIPGDDFAVYANRD